MINPFSCIKNNSRWVLYNKTIVIEYSTVFNFIYYDLNDWWKTQQIIPKYKKINKVLFYLKAENIKY